jgi:hypothetical protein
VLGEAKVYDEKEDLIKEEVTKKGDNKKGNIKKPKK